MLRGLDLSSNFSFGALGSHKAMTLPSMDASESSAISTAPNGSTSSIHSLNGIGSSLDFNHKFSLRDNQGSSLEKVRVHNLLNDTPKEPQHQDKIGDTTAVHSLLSIAALTTPVTPMKTKTPDLPKPNDLTTLPPLSSFDLPISLHTPSQIQLPQPLPNLPSVSTPVSSVLPQSLSNGVNTSPSFNALPSTFTPDQYAMISNLAGNQKQWWQANASQLKQIHTQEQVLKPVAPQFKQQKPPSKSNRGIFDNHWKQHFTELREFKKLNGHTNVTRTTDQWRNLGNWVAEQRRKMRKGKLTRVQFQLLQSIGFEWDRSYYFKPNAGGSFEGLTAEELREIEEITGNMPL